MSLGLVVTAPKAESDVPQEAIRVQLSRMLQNSIFVQSNRLSRFLTFTVETTLAGQADILKEYLIGTEVYDRKAPYHPSTDSIVRSEARRLRNKLKQYYESVGRDDSVFIYYRPGGYVPVFRLQRKNPNLINANQTLGDFLVEGLVAQGLSVRDAFRELEVKIVFEGTMRISHPSIAPEDCSKSKKRKWISARGTSKL
jgi:hypothetical protein